MGYASVLQKVGMAVSAAALLLLAGCTENGNDEKPADGSQQVQNPSEAVSGETDGAAELTPEEAIANVQSVLDIELNGPNRQYAEVMQQVMDSSGQPEPMNDGYEKLMDDLFGPYFTEDGLDRFKSAGSFRYHLIDNTDYALRFIDADIHQSDVTTAANQYLFEAVVEVEAPGMEAARYPLTGRAIFNTKEGKIGDFQLAEPEPEFQDRLFELANRQTDAGE